MKNLFKFAVIVSALFLFAGQGNAQLSLGVKLGMNASSLSGYEKASNFIMEQTQMNWTVSDYSIGYTFLPHIGAVAQYTFPQRIFLQGELLFSLQGCSEKTSDKTENVWMGFAKLPVYGGCKIKVTKNTDVIVGLGPYVAYGVVGSDGSYGDEGQFKRFDAGLSVMAGIQFKHLQVTAGYDKGFIDLMDIGNWKTTRDENNLPGVNMDCFRVSLAFFLQ